MKGTLFLIAVAVSLAISSVALSQSSNPVRGTRPSLVKIEPVKPKELPDAKLSITSLKYNATLPGARITIKNAGGKTSDVRRVEIILLAAEKHPVDGSWPDITKGVRAYIVPVWCPYDLKGVGLGKLALGQPTLNGRTKTPAIKGGESVTLDVKFDHINQRKVNVTSLVDFTLHNNCRPPDMGNRPWSAYKYFIGVLIQSAVVSEIDLKDGVYLNP